jgi:O-antigen/teichoic acid export membrane protein
LLGSYWIEAILRLVYSAAIARFLGAEQFGVWSYVIALYTFLIGLVGFGIETQIPLRLGRSRARIAAVVQTFFAVRVLLLALAVAALLLAALATEPGITRSGILISAMALIGRGLSLFARCMRETKRVSASGSTTVSAFRTQKYL